MQWIHTVLLTHALTLTLTVVLLGGILMRRNREWVHYAFSSLLLGSMIWLITNGISEWLTIHASPDNRFGMVAGLAIQWMALSGFALCELLPAHSFRRNSLIRLGIIGLITSLLVPGIFSEDWISDRRRDGEFTAATYGIWFQILSIWASLVVLMGLAILFRKLMREKDARLRMHLRLFLFGALLSTSMAFVFSYLMPLLGLHHLFFLGVNSVIILFSLMVYSILNYGMFDLRTVFLKLGLRILISLVVSIAIYTGFLTFILNQNLSEFSPALALVLSLFFLSAILFTRFILPAIDRVLFRKLPPAEQSILAFFDQVAPEVPMESSLMEVLKILQNALPTRQAIVLAADFENKLYLHRQGSRLEFDEKATMLFHRLLRIQKMPAAFFKNINRIFFLDENNDWPARKPRQSRSYKRIYSYIKKMQDHWKSQGLQLSMPLVYGNQLCGLVLLGEKSDDFPYFKNDLQFLDALRQTIAAVLQYKRTMHRMQRIHNETQLDMSRLGDMLGDGRRPVEYKAEALANQQLVYNSASMQQVLTDIKKMAPLDKSILIHGETGTGKELIARIVHRDSARKLEPFLAVNCAAIPESLWEDEIFGHIRGAYTDARKDRPGRIVQAGNGILFFDEIGEMPLSMQAKLLRLLQENEYTPVGSDEIKQAACRFIFATNRDLLQMSQDGSFREDLYYRINVLQIQLAPLRERTADIPVLLDYYINKISKELKRPETPRLDKTAVQLLMRYNWPGNIRELENLLIRCVALHEDSIIRSGQLPVEVRNFVATRPRMLISQSLLEQTGNNLSDMVDEYTRQIIQTTLKKYNGNRTHTAEALGIKRGSLLYRMKELDIK